MSTIANCAQHYIAKVSGEDKVFCRTCFADQTKIYALRYDGKGCDDSEKPSVYDSSDNSLGDTPENFFGCKELGTFNNKKNNICKKCWTAEDFNFSKKEFLLKSTKSDNDIHGNCYQSNRGSCNIKNCNMLQGIAKSVSDTTFKFQIEWLKCQKCSANFDLNTGSRLCD